MEAEFTLDELRSVLESLKDVGPGLDGVSAVSLSKLHASTQQLMIDLFNDVWRSGCTPESWNRIRVVLHYKGKGSDP